MIEHGFRDRRGRLISLRVIGDDWRAVADVAPRDDQRRFVAALAALYLLLSDRGGLWTSLAVYADDLVVGHVMWAVDDDGSHWIGGVLVDAPGRLYRALGFSPTGEIQDSELVLERKPG